ncbi:MAG: 16S rRNA (guanine(966)-N(2))-methyltransferase RsmD [Rhodoferax sp.]|nr:16S rRNA (guanine(966)-N(2))-methyltransferase RsmD [Rhodoferax sp.]
MPGMKRAPSETKSRPPRPPRPRAVQSHEIRIIGGQFKRTKLQVADKPGLRPTPDRVRETLFNWLGQDLSGWRCLDAFAGTGALGFEAASRGAAHVLLVEQDAALVAQLQRVQAQLKAQAVQVVRGDAVAALRHAPAGSLELIFLDPPFDSAVFEAAVQAAAPALAAAGFLYLEAPKRWSDEQLHPLGLQLHRHLKAGMVHAHLLKRIEPVSAPAR